ncbi:MULTISPECIES: hypothetical protein [Pseudoxanthomonas]|nr:hypothetical protein [Pseudoxanthomonas mexicana]MCP1584115.1 hypothetical protein [Pseudoxanthomonas mexicana]
MEKAKVSMAVTEKKMRVAALALLLGLVACAPAAPEHRLRARFGEMQAAVEKGQAGDFMEGVSPDFTGESGMDRAALHNLLRARMLADSHLGVTTGPLEVVVQGDNATVAFDVVLTAGNGRLLPDQARAYRVTTAWRTEDDEWRVYHARWNGTP